jgi:hypothetical protein
MLAEDGADRQRWTRGDGWLTVDAGYEVADRRWLRLARDPAGARASAVVALDGLIPLPSGALRWRYDRADTLPEEWRVPLLPAETAEVMAILLEQEGWEATGTMTMGPAQVQRFTRGRQSVATAVWPTNGGAAELAVGESGCLPFNGGSGPSAWRELSVYLDAVPAPPGARIVAFDYSSEDDRATEEWLAACTDLDFFTAVLGERLGEAGWTAPPGTAWRVPGGQERTAAPPDDLPGVFYAARTHEDSALRVQVARQAMGRLAPAGSSLLFDDLPLPPGSVADHLRTDTDDGWQFLESYSHGFGGDVVGFYRQAMVERGWAYERGHDFVAGVEEVYFAGGEDVVVRVHHDEAALELGRRRVCESGEPVPPGDIGLESRHLLEMPVYPGAVYVGFSDSEETYRVYCADLDLIVTWYRAALERGNWALAGTVGPEDRFHRELMFVRPEERELPPEERTAWAEVMVDRDWPYEYTLTLRRDPGGERPQPGTP